MYNGAPSEDDTDSSATSTPESADVLRAATVAASSSASTNSSLLCHDTCPEESVMSKPRETTDSRAVGEPVGVVVSVEVRDFVTDAVPVVVDVREAVFEGDRVDDPEVLGDKDREAEDEDVCVDDTETLRELLPEQESDWLGLLVVCTDLGDVSWLPVLVELGD